MTYFRQLVKGMPEMLRGYNTRILKQIQGRLDKLQVGDCCYVEVSYIDNGSGISPYNYDFQILETPHAESRSNLSTATGREEGNPPFAAPSVDNFSAPSSEELGSDWQRFDGGPGEEQVVLPISTEADLIGQIAAVHEDVRKLQADMDLIKKLFVQVLGRIPQESPEVSQAVETKSEPVVIEPVVDPVAVEEPSQALVEEDNPQEETTLDQDEQAVIRYISSEQIVTESQLKDACQLADPTNAMQRLMDKMSQSNFPWISVEEEENGELIYVWTPPED
jgi:hypothetical protein